MEAHRRFKTLLLLKQFKPRGHNQQQQGREVKSLNRDPSEFSKTLWHLKKVHTYNGWQNPACWHAKYQRYEIQPSGWSRRSSEKWSFVVGRVVPEVSEVCFAFIFRVKLSTRMLSDSEDDSNIFLRNVGKPPAQRLKVIKRKTNRT
jgi:hypothetical protein